MWREFLCDEIANVKRMLTWRCCWCKENANVTCMVADVKSMLTWRGCWGKENANACDVVADVKRMLTWRGCWCEENANSTWLLIWGQHRKQLLTSTNCSAIKLFTMFGVFCEESVWCVWWGECLVCLARRVNQFLFITGRKSCLHRAGDCRSRLVRWEFLHHCMNLSKWTRFSRGYKQVFIWFPSGFKNFLIIWCRTMQSIQFW